MGPLQTVRVEMTADQRSRFNAYFADIQTRQLDSYGEYIVASVRRMGLSTFRKNKIKKESDELTTICSQLKMPASDGKSYLTDVSDQVQLFRLIQYPTNFEQNKRVAKGGGHVAKIARAELEKQLGRSIVSPANAKGLKAPDDVKQVESGDSDDQ